MIDIDLIEPNVELLETVLTDVIAHPEHHHQESWGKRTPCGTAYCLAGLAIVTVYPDAEFHWVGDADLAYASILDVPIINGLTNISFTARVLLGLNWYEQDYLFNGDRTINELTTALNHFKAGQRIDGLLRYTDENDQEREAPNWIPQPSLSVA